MTAHGVVKCECGALVKRLCNCHHDAVAEIVTSCRACEHRYLSKPLLAKLAQEMADKLKRPA